MRNVYGVCGSKRNVDTFFANLPRDRLNPAEQRLLAALQECVAATKALLLPLDVSVQQWADARVANEVHSFARLWTGAHHGHPTPLQAHPPAPPAPPARPSSHAWEESEMHNPAKKARFLPDNSPGGLAKNHTEEWLASLPQDKLSAIEKMVRDALLDNLRARHSKDKTKAKTWGVGEIVSQKGNPRMHKLCQQLLPAGVELTDWIDNRIADHIGVSWDDTRACAVLTLGDKYCQVGQGVAAEKGGNTKNETNATRGGRNEEASKRFMESLPPDELTPKEFALRDALIVFVNQYDETNPGIAPKVSDAAGNKGDPYLRECCRDLLPTGVGLRDWINCRIGGEFQALWDEERKCSVIVVTTTEECEPPL